MYDHDTAVAGGPGSFSPASSRPDKAVWIIPAVVVVLDQITKWTVYATMTLYQSIPVAGDWIRLTYIHNPGGAFGVRWGHTGIYFVAATLVIAWIIWHLWRHGAERRLSIIALSLVLGGAVGNMIDRVVLGEVIDFIDVEFPDMRIPAFDFGFLHHAGVEMDRWPTFNIADSAVTVGIIVLLFTLWRDPVCGGSTQVSHQADTQEAPDSEV